MNVKLTACLFCILMVGSVYGQIDNDFKIPETWEKDFLITYSYHGSMSGGKTEIRITVDSCTYISRPHHSKKPKHIAFKLKEADRTAILAKLAELKADKIKAEVSMHAVYDGWSESFCLGTHCVQGGTSVKMDEENKNAFLEVCRYLEEFAGKKGR